MTAKIGLEDVRIHAPHGFFEEEHRMGNEFSIDVEVEATITEAAENDDLGGTVNYATIYYLLQAEMKKPTQLLEALAYRMGNRILNQFDSVLSVTLRLRKLNPPLGGKVGAAVVEVSLGSSSGGGGFGGGGYGAAAPRRQDTFEDPPGFAEDRDGPFGGGGGFSGGGGLGIPQKAVPPPPVFDEQAYAEEEYDDDLILDIPEGEEYDDDDFDDEDFADDLDFDGLDFDDLDLGDFDPSSFNFDDLDDK